MISNRNLHQSAKKRVVEKILPALSAGTDVADMPFFRCPCDLEIINLYILPIVANAGIDAGNDSVWLIEKASTALAGKTYTTAFPAKGVVDELTLTTTLANLKCAEGDIITYTVTNGTTANPNETILGMEYVPTDASFFDVKHATLYSN